MEMSYAIGRYEQAAELLPARWQQAARRGILPEQPAEGRYMGRLLSRAGGGR